ncbi:MAG: hypothetical protein ACLUDU_18995 [Butyricimonas faecihominis]
MKDWTASVIKQAEIDKYLMGERILLTRMIFADIEKYKIPITTSSIFYKIFDIKILTPAKRLHC